MEMHLRKLRMLQTCKKYGDVLKAPDMLAKRNTLIWDLQDNLVYCRIAKVSPWMIVFHGEILGAFLGESLGCFLDSLVLCHQGFIAKRSLTLISDFRGM